jgi:hypothetical protein
MMKSPWALLVAGISLCFSLSAQADDPLFSIDNPYDGVEWETATARKGNFHTHSTQSDGALDPEDVIDTYASYGYSVLALTDHNTVTYPWSTYGRDPATVGVVDIQGNELSSGHHIVSLFSGYASTSSDETTLLTGVGAAGGLAFIAHPGRYSYDAQWYVDHYLAQSHCVGQEIYNQGDRYPNDRELWDEVLTILMPDRPVWGFSNDDAHLLSHMGRNRTYFPITGDLTQTAVSNALVSGCFFATYSTSPTYEPPMVTGLEVDEMTGVITLTATNYTSVRWISGGIEVATGESIDLSATSAAVDYVRAELHGSEGSTYLNPFGIRAFGNRSPVVDAGADQIVVLPSSATLNGVVSDDDLPEPVSLTTLWEQVDGPGTVTFTDPSSETTTAAFSQAGTYLLRLSATDGELSSSNELQVVVNDAVDGGWTAYNDCSWESGQLSFNITTIGLDESGSLIDYTTGAAVGPAIELINNGANQDGTGGPMSDSGTDAYATFNGIVSFENVNWYGDEGWYVDAVITGLDPNRIYEFATSVNRGNSDYTDRWSKFTLSGADAYTQSSTSGVQVNSDDSVSFWAGDNSSNGYVARWTGIRAGADGTITVRAEADGQGDHNTRKAYAFDGILLRDLGPADSSFQASLTAPLSGASFARNEEVSASASLLNGTDPETVEFFLSDGGSFESAGTGDALSAYACSLGTLSPGSYSLYAVATDGDAAQDCTATNTFTVTSDWATQMETLISAGANWNYLDDGSDQGTAWSALDFNDNLWEQGAAPLGYGDSWIVTEVYSPASPDRTITTYYRCGFEVEQAESFTSLDLELRRDDGAVVYLNGTEVFRSNMPTGSVDYLTTASDAAGSSDETTWFTTTLDCGSLLDGDNVIAVEVHQSSTTSSDTTFDLELTGTFSTAPTEPSEWTAFNDCVYQESGYKATNATVYGIGNQFDGLSSGTLRNIDTGDELPIIVTFTQTGGVTWQAESIYGGSDCAAGTDAYETFGTVVDMGGVIYYGSAGWIVQAQFDGLDPDGVYEFSTSANRDGASYTDRTTLYSIQGADECYAAGTEGVVTDGTNQTFCTGYNTSAGNVARWVGIRPGEDGSFTVTATHAADASDGRKAYAFDVFRLHRSEGFEAWAQQQGERGTEEDFECIGPDGVAQAFSYAFGDNLKTNESLFCLRIQNGKPVFDLPEQDVLAETYVNVSIHGCTNLNDRADACSIEVQPAADTTGKPAHRQWLEPDGITPESMFFWLEAERVE